MIGPAGSGKSTYVKNTIKENENSMTKHIWVSRDAIRFKMLQETEGYFDKENEVFAAFVKQIGEALQHEDVVVYADATHLTERGRNKVLDKLNLKNVEVVPTIVYPPIKQTLRQNDQRSGRAHVPKTVIRRMYEQFEMPTFNEKHEYSKIVKVGEYNI